MMKYLVLNPDYNLINDINRIIICDFKSLSFIHPLFATILAYFDKDDDIELEKKIEIISNELLIEKNEINDFVKLLINNDENISFGDSEALSEFPKKVIISKPTDYKSRNYSLKDFFIGDNKFDSKQFRLNKPIDFTLVINTKCYTNCIYCYADLKYDYLEKQLSTNRIIEIIQEAKRLNMRSVEITGGEFFLDKDWDIILAEFLKNGFDPKPSTKVPLNEKVIKKIAEIGLERVQLSLDCLDEKVLIKTLNVNEGYVDKIKSSISLYDKYNILLKINTIITKYNCNYNLIDELLTFLLGCNNIKEITIGVAGYSINNCNNYLGEIAPPLNEINKLLEKIKLKYSSIEKINIGDVESFSGNFRFKEADFFTKAVCTGNLHQFYLLPDGKVTLCEELYWHPKFILGDLTNQSIMEMWRGEQALNLYNISQKEFKDDSACKACNDFDYCHLNASVCWKEVMESYGKDKWYYPDPRCPKAPKPKIQKYIY